MEKKARIEEKAFEFSKRIIRFVLSLDKDELRFTAGKQVIRSGTSIGANIEEAQGGISKADFIHGMNIAKKEARETKYWLRLFSEFKKAKKEKIKSLINECDEILRMLTAIVKTAQGK